MTYPPQPGGYGQQPDPYGQPVTGVPSSPGPYGQPVTGPPTSPAYGQPPYPAPGFSGPPAAQDPGPRPGSVTAAAVLMVGNTVVFVVLAGLGLFMGLQSLSEEAKTCDPVDCDDVTAGKVFVIIVAAIFLIAAMGVIALALGVLRGRNGARITTFVLYGIFGAFGLCSGGFALLFLIGSSSESTYDSEAATMGMGGGISLISSLVLLIILAATIVLLAIKSTSTWFREMQRARTAGIL